MKLTELLNKHRQYYLNHFLDLLNKSDDGTVELLLEMKNEEPDELFRLYRYDLVTKKDGEFGITEFNTDGFLNHQDIQFTINNKKLILSPIVWNGVEISINDSFSSFENVRNWAYKWLDIEDRKNKNSDNLQGVIHNISKPKNEKNFTSFSVDLGSSPVNSITELIEILSNDPEVKIIKLESTWMTHIHN